MEDQFLVAMRWSVRGVFFYNVSLHVPFGKFRRKAFSGAAVLSKPLRAAAPPICAQQDAPYRVFLAMSWFAGMCW